MRVSSSNRVRSKKLDEYARSLLRLAKENPEKLGSGQWRTLLRPDRFLRQYVLDDLLLAGQKLGKRFFIVLIDEADGLDSREFSDLFRSTYLTDERNERAVELAEERGVVVLGNETIGRFLQRSELFLSSDLYDIVRVMRKIKGKNVGVSDFHFESEDESLKALLTHTILRMQFITMNMQNILKILGVTLIEFAIIVTLYLSARPLEREVIRRKVEQLIGKRRGNMTGVFRNLTSKKLCRTLEKESTHIKRKIMLFMLTESSHNLINNFVQRVTLQTIGIPYE